MLNIYIGRKNLPKDKVFIFDPEALSIAFDLTKDAITKEILKVIEQAVPQTSDSFTDRFGRGLFCSCLSTTTKILLGIHQTAKVINASELGENGFDYLSSMDRGFAYFNCLTRDTSWLKLPVVINGVVCNTSSELNLEVIKANEIQ